MSNRMPIQIYRSMIRCSMQKDPTIIPDIRRGLMTFKEPSLPNESFQYYDKKGEMTHIHGPYKNDTTNVLSFIKYCMLELPNNEYTINRLFYAHKELHTFIECKKQYDDDHDDNHDDDHDDDHEENTDKAPFKSSFETSFF